MQKRSSVLFGGMDYAWDLIFIDLFRWFLFYGVLIFNSLMYQSFSSLSSLMSVGICCLFILSFTFFVPQLSIRRPSFSLISIPMSYLSYYSLHLPPLLLIRWNLMFLYAPGHANKNQVYLQNNNICISDVNFCCGVIYLKLIYNQTSKAG